MVCVGPVRKPHCLFSHEAAHYSTSSLQRYYHSVIEYYDLTPTNLDKSALKGHTVSNDHASAYIAFLYCVLSHMSMYVDLSLK